MKDQYVTVVYRIVDASEWVKTSPLKYAHNGLSACLVSIGDVVEERNALISALELIEKEGNLLSSDIATKALDSLWKDK